MPRTPGNIMQRAFLYVEFVPQIEPARIAEEIGHNVVPNFASVAHTNSDTSLVTPYAAMCKDF